jgi:hypothetical protein
MIKIKITNIIASFLFLIFILGGCINKEEIIQQELNDVDEVTQNLHKGFYEFEIFGGSLKDVFEIENYGLNGIYSLTRTQTGELQGKHKTLFECIKSVNPSLLQLLSLKNSTDSFSACRKGITPLFIKEIIDLQKEHNELRGALLEKFEKQQISEEVFILELLKIRNDLKQKVLLIKNKYDAEFRLCLLDYVKNIKGALDKDQWNDFKKCI